jgi:hypothetical protein
MFIGGWNGGFSLKKTKWGKVKINL